MRPQTEGQTVTIGEFWCGNQFSGIHQVQRIERSFDRAHDVERRAVLLGQVFQLADADAVLAAAGAAEPQRPPDQPFVQRADGRELSRVVRVEHENQMEVAVAGVTDQRGHDPGVTQVGLGFEDALGKV